MIARSAIIPYSIVFWWAIGATIAFLVRISMGNATSTEVFSILGIAISSDAVISYILGLATFAGGLAIRYIAAWKKRSPFKAQFVKDFYSIDDKAWNKPTVLGVGTHELMLCISPRIDANLDRVGLRPQRRGMLRKFGHGNISKESSPIRVLRFKDVTPNRPEDILSDGDETDGWNGMWVYYRPQPYSVRPDHKLFYDVCIEVDKPWRGHLDFRHDFEEMGMRRVHYECNFRQETRQAPNQKAV